MAAHHLHPELPHLDPAPADDLRRRARTLTRDVDPDEDLQEPGLGRHEHDVADTRVLAPDDPRRRVGFSTERCDDRLDDGQHLGAHRVLVGRTSPPFAQAHAVLPAATGSFRTLTEASTGPSSEIGCGTRRVGAVSCGGAYP